MSKHLKEGMAIIHIETTKDLKCSVKSVASQKEMSMKQLIEIYLQEGLDREGKEEGKKAWFSNIFK